MNTFISIPAPFRTAALCISFLILTNPFALTYSQAYVSSLSKDNAHSSSHQALEPHNGAYLPVKGTIRGLVVFVQTRNDTVKNSNWPLGQLPQWSDRYVTRLQQYYNDMSFGTLDLQLDIYQQCMRTRLTEDEYVSRGHRFGKAIMDIIDTLDVTIDFSSYDLHTSSQTPYRVSEGPDGKVDLMIVIFRSISNATFLLYAGISELGFTGYKFVDGSLQRYFYGGSGQHNDSAASGITMCKSPGQSVVIDAEYAFNTTIHELGHKLLGDGHPTEVFGGLGIMANSGNGYAMNSFERHLSGYNSFRTLNAHRDTIITLHDYVTTGDAALLPVPEGIFSYYSFEFRGKQSQWDTAPIEGLYIYRIYDSKSYTSKSIQVESAEGRFDWALDSSTMKPYPYRANAIGGYNRLQRIRINDKVYWADGWRGDARSAFTLRRPELTVLKNPSPDFILGSDTIHTNLHIRLLSLDSNSATLRISYTEPAILSDGIISDQTNIFGGPYPQPAVSGEVLKIPVRSGADGRLRADIHDLLGRHVARYDDLRYAVNGEIHIPLKGIGSGIYTVTLQTTASLYRSRIFIAQ